MATHISSRSLLSKLTPTTTAAAAKPLAFLFSRSFSSGSVAPLLTKPTSSHSLPLLLRRLRPLAAASSSLQLGRSSPAIRSLSTRATSSSLNDQNPNWSNRPPKETILLEGCDFKHWLIVLEPPDPNFTRDEIIDLYIKTLASVIGSEEEARMKIYSVSTRCYFAFGALVDEEVSEQIKKLPNVRWVLPDSFLDVKNKDYGGEPFINGQAVPYDPKYHEEWIRNNARANERNRRNDRPRSFDRSRNYERRRENMPQGSNMPPRGGNMPPNNFNRTPPNMGGGVPQGNVGGGAPQGNMGGGAPQGNYGGIPPNMGGGVPQGNVGGGVPQGNVGGGAPQGNYGGMPPNMGGGAPQGNYGGMPPNMGGGAPPGNMGGGVPQGNMGGGAPQGNMGGGVPQGNYGGMPLNYGGTQPNNYGRGTQPNNYGGMPPPNNAGMMPNAGWSSNTPGNMQHNNQSGNTEFQNSYGNGGVPGGNPYQG
ncbi:hypothetical protein Ddye_026618 [Dipteronia dyeriana]|uniref:MORF/ORRM1/DAG-like MORF domain-containing protein n=1 Tax=Dipteronia dyeriana TaxID=168575 RepID=A0AAD9WQM5_9ROSI|nr:hypothetical protein Ddye_026618 [Dipteronia dyeriana]